MDREHCRWGRRSCKELTQKHPPRSGISALVSQTSFGGETSRNVAKCRLFSQAMPPPTPTWPLHYLDDWKQFHLDNEVTAIASHRTRESCHKPLKTLYVLTKTLLNERSRQSTTVLEKNGNLTSSKREVEARWTEYFKEVLNKKSSANPIIDDQEDDLHITH